MLKRGKSPRSGRIRPAWRLPVGLSILAFSVACDERDRLTFPDPGDGIGPVTTIDQPHVTDTTVPEGPGFFVNGRTVDPDGVDTVYFLVTGGNQDFDPFLPRPRSDTVRFGLPLTTTGRGGDTMLVQIYGVDIHGSPGDTSTRRIAVE
jgi:hypothetical protein